MRISKKLCNIFYQNVRGLRTKTIEIYNAISSSEYDVIALTETWLDSDILDSEIVNSDYNLYRCDRNFSERGVTRGGGVLIAIKNDFNCTLLDLSYFKQCAPSIDILGLKIVLNIGCIYLYNLYIPPGLPVEQYEMFFEVFGSLHHFINNEYQTIITGDFNLSEYKAFVDSNNNSIIPSRRIQALLNFMDFTELKQHNEIQNSSSRILDLVLSNLELSVNASLEPLVNVDTHHPPLDFNILLYCVQNKCEKNNVATYNFKKANFIELYAKLLEVDWSVVQNFHTVDSACNNLYLLLDEVFASTVPKRVPQRRTYPSWYTGDIIRKIKNKSKFHRKYKESGQVEFLEQFNDLRRTIKHDVASSRENFVQQSEISLKNNTSNFWAYVNSMRNTSRLPNKMFYNDTVRNGPQEIVDAFACFFESAFVQSSQYQPFSGDNLRNVPLIQCPTISEDDVYKALRKMKPKMTTGPDGIPSFLLKDCAVIFSKPLSVIFNLALKTCSFPSCWKVSKICPVFKKGNKTYIENHRPIAILCNFSKVFEIVLFEKISPSLHPQIVESQHGFIKGRSTQTNLICLTQFVAATLDTQGQVDVVYTDFSKAFDRLDHGRLLKKISDFGLTNSFISFLHSYLNERELIVEYHGFRSNKFIAKSGVPQGSVLGPLLFIIFINDICQDLESNILLYADDCKLFRKISDVNDCLKLQNDIDTLTQWCENNCLPLNAAKCCCLSFTRKINPINSEYFIHSTKITRTTHFKDLGVTFDSKLSFKLHINTITSQAYQQLGFIIRNSKLFSKDQSVTLLFNALVRPRLEYASTVWNPHYKVYISDLENIQRKFLKYLSYRNDGIYPIQGISHGILLTRFQTTLLESRRTIAEAIFLYKIINYIIDSPQILEQIGLQVPRLSTRSTHLFHLRTPRTNVLKYSPIYRMCTLFNELYSDVDIFCINLKKFRNILRSMD